jgi:muramoyltetrapeptide carboxypeptidase
MKILKRNGTIGIIAPAFYPNQDKLEYGINYLKRLGYRIKRGKSLNAKKKYFAGDDNLRIKDIHNMFMDNDVDIIMCARGGWGSLRFLDKIDYNLINKNRKLLVGYSDITSLQLALWEKISLPSLSGAMVAVEMSEKMNALTEDFLWNQLLNKQDSYTIRLKKNGIRTMIPGKMNGTLIGGCLSMITAQLATPYSPDYSNKILFIEDINESLYKIDRQLSQLHHAGVLDKLSGLIIGDFINYDSDRTSFDDLIKEYLSPRAYPVITDFPYGHGTRKISLPIGSSSLINTDEDFIEIGSCYADQRNS